MPRFGYACVSPSARDLTHQVEQLQAAGCDVVRSEAGAPGSREKRGELADLLPFLRQGDELVVERLDCLGSTVGEVLPLVHELEDRGAVLRVLEPEVSTGGTIGRTVIAVLGMAADMERNRRKDRQRAGIEAAKAKGVYQGRRKQIDDAEICRRVAQGTTKAQVARDLGVSRMTVYRALAGAEAEKSDGARDEEEPEAQKPGPKVPVNMYVDVETRYRYGKGRKKAVAGIRLMLQQNFGAIITSDGDYEFEIPEYCAFSGRSIDEVVQDLCIDIEDLADAFNCVADIHVQEIDGQDRVW